MPSGGEVSFRSYLRRNWWRLGAQGKLGRLFWRSTCPKDGDRRAYINFLAACGKYELRETLETLWDAFWERQLIKEADAAGR